MLEEKINYMLKRKIVTLSALMSLFSPMISCESSPKKYDSGLFYTKDDTIIGG